MCILCISVVLPIADSNAPVSVFKTITIDLPRKNYIYHHTYIEREGERLRCVCEQRSKSETQLIVLLGATYTTFWTDKLLVVEHCVLLLPQLSTWFVSSLLIVLFRPPNREHISRIWKYISCAVYAFLLLLATLAASAYCIGSVTRKRTYTHTHTFTHLCSHLL